MNLSRGDYETIKKKNLLCGGGKGEVGEVDMPHKGARRFSCV